MVRGLGFVCLGFVGFRAYRVEGLGSRLSRVEGCGMLLILDLGLRRFSDCRSAPHESAFEASGMYPAY